MSMSAYSLSRSEINVGPFYFFLFSGALALRESLTATLAQPLGCHISTLAGVLLLTGHGVRLVTNWRREALHHG